MLLRQLTDELWKVSTIFRLRIQCTSINRCIEVFSTAGNAVTLNFNSFIYVNEIIGESTHSIDSIKIVCIHELNGLLMEMS
jgi:hypothetical protein